MTARRLEPVRKPVTLRVDGRRVVAEEGEPVAVALVADGRWLLGRSVKYHRPRGPVCFDGRCDGCLMRVDGAPNVMTCRIAAREGMDVRTQNVLGSAEQDLLSATDWFFPHGLDHHEMFTRFKPVNQVMQKVARRIAGIGELPDRTEAPRSVREVEADVLVLGGGAAGLAAASEAAVGGGLRVWLLEERASLRDQLKDLEGEARAKNVMIAFAHEAVAVYEHTVLVKAPDGLLRFRTPRVILATGTHEGPLAVAGNDRPGVLTPSGLVALLRNQVVPGKRVAVVGEGPRANDVMEVVSLSGAIALGPFPEKVVLRVLGSKAVSGIEIVNGRESARLTCDVVVMAGTPSAAFELAAQGGAGVRWYDGHFTVDASPDDGATAIPWLRAAGGCTGLDDFGEIIHQGRAAGRAVATELATDVITKPREQGEPAGGDTFCHAKRAQKGGSAAPPRQKPSAAPPKQKPSAAPPKQKEKILLCRCEDVTVRDFEQAVAHGHRDLESVKRYTGFGTGWCQGKHCLAMCARVLVEIGGDPPDGPITPRPPFHPVPLAWLARLPTETDET